MEEKNITQCRYNNAHQPSHYSLAASDEDIALTCFDAIAVPWQGKHNYIRQPQ